MLDLFSPQAVSIYAGFSTGALAGATILTQTEMLRRGAIMRPVDPFQRVPSKVALFAVLRGLLICVGSFAVGVGFMRAGGLHGVDATTKGPFEIALLVGAASGKAARYFYWRSKIR